jgi:hypothetical protein
MLDNELDLEGNEYPCPECSSFVWELINFAAVGFTINTYLRKGSRQTDMEIKEIGGHKTLTIPGLKYELKCITCDYVTTPEELGMIRPRECRYDHDLQIYYIPVEIDLGTTKIIGRSVLERSWGERYLEMDTARNGNIISVIKSYVDSYDTVLSRMAEIRLKELEEK